MLWWFLILGLWLRQGLIAGFRWLWLIDWLGRLCWLVCWLCWWRWLVDLLFGWWLVLLLLWLVHLFQDWWLLVNVNWRMSSIDNMRCRSRSGIGWSAWWLVSRGGSRSWCIVSLLGRWFVARLRFVHWLWWSISRLWWGI